MYVALVGTVLHAGWTFLFVKHLSYGAAGAGVAASITNLTILAGNLLVSRLQDSMKEALSVSCCDPAVFRNIGEYLRIGIPGSVIMIFDWGCYQILSLLSGYLGVKEQAAQIILWNTMSIMWQIPFGFQIASCAFVGQQIGAGELQKAKSQ